MRKWDPFFQSNAVQRRNEDAQEQRVMGDDDNDDRWDPARCRGRERWCAFPFLKFLVVNMTAVALESQECGILEDVRFYTMLNMGHFWTPSLALDLPQCK